MLDWTGSSDHDDVLLRLDGLGWAPSLAATLLTRVRGSGLSDLVAMRCRHRSWRIDMKINMNAITSDGNGVPKCDVTAIHRHGNWF